MKYITIRNLPLQITEGLEKEKVDHYQTRLGLCPWPARWLFETGLHFLARLIPQGAR